MKDIIIAYVPVIHRGYIDYFASTGAKTIYALQASDLLDHEHLTRDVRALNGYELSAALEGLGYTVLPYKALRGKKLQKGCKVFIPEDDVTRNLRIDAEAEIVWGSWFLRWDWSKATAAAAVTPDADLTISHTDPMYSICSERMHTIMEASQRSSDWWRQVGAMVVAENDTTIVAYNTHYPNEHAPYMDGDPRLSFNPGEFIEISSALHAEQACIAEAARRGVCLEYAEIYVTTFPCNLCAPLIVAAGIESVFFTGGYSNLNGQRTLRERGVRLIHVEI